MTLRTKTFVIVGIAVVALMVVLFASWQSIVLGNFEELERTDTSRHAELAVAAIDNRIAALDTVLFDWATWDDTYVFVQDRNEEYIESNLVDETFISAPVNLIMILDNSGEPIFAKAFDLEDKREIPVPPSLEQQLSPGSVLVQHTDTESSITGILLLEEGPMMIGSRPIVTSQGEGPIGGTMIMARFLDAQEIESLSQLTQLSIAVHGFNDPGIPPDFDVARSSLAEGAPTFVQPLSDRSVAGYARLDDIYGNPALVLRVDMPREIYQQGLATNRYFFLSVLALGAIFFLAFLLFERLILSRVSNLNKSVGRIGRSGDIVKERIFVKGRDEIASLSAAINRMLGALTATQDRLHRSEQRNRAILEAMPDSICQFSRNGTIEAYKPGRDGHPPVLVTVGVGRHVRDVMPPEFCEEAMGHVVPALQSGTVHVFEYPLLHEGQKHHYEARMVACGKDEVLTVVRDVTEQRHAEEALKEEKEEVERSKNQIQAVNKELETFAYSVSHDLRAPLRSIDGFSQALLEDHADKLDDEGKDYLQRVRSATQRMAQLIDDLLNFSRMTRAEMRCEVIELSALAQKIAMELQQSEPGRDVEFVIAPDIVAQGDTNLLQVVLENLLGNAWKFSKKRAHAKIEFGCAEIDGQPAYFVRDNGVGFDMAHADRLFGAFQRLHSDKEFEGTGIGLATVQRIIHRHGGRIWAESAVEQGATFHFTLPSTREVSNEAQHDPTG